MTSWTTCIPTSMRPIILRELCDEEAGTVTSGAGEAVVEDKESDPFLLDDSKDVLEA
jgi:hypothetical protein